MASRCNGGPSSPVSRRGLLRLGGAALGAAAGAGLVAPRLFAAVGAAAGSPGALSKALAESDLVYLTPLHGDGRESRCQAEVWFVADGGDAVVVTAADAWRARAVSNGLRRTRLWVGDVGVWSKSGGAYRGLPSTLADAVVIDDADDQTRMLERFGDKYPLSWIMWGPRFRGGLEDGSRVMIRYRPLADA